MGRVSLFFIMVIIVIEARLGMSLVVAASRCLGDRRIEI